MNEGKIDYLNVGCGNKFHRDWVNLDLKPNGPDVIACDLLKGIPFQDEKFAVVYHSQVLEHLPKDKALEFIKECYRVLKKGGMIRVVVPDLENIVDEYKKFLNENLKVPSSKSEANYDWIMLELFDQSVRNHSGGQMQPYLQQKKMKNESYVIDRIGHLGRVARKSLASPPEKFTEKLNRSLKVLGPLGLSKKIFGHTKRKIISLFSSENHKLFDFKTSGEVHMWMYDRYSLARLLREAGFSDIEHKNAFKSDIPKWDSYKLDVKNGLVYDPTSLFMEARK